MNLIKQAIIAGALAFATLNVASAAPILNISTDGTSTLLGASGVNVGGTLYDVTFGDGIYSLGSITAFTTGAGAQAASIALLDQVLVNAYDELRGFNTNGCTSFSQCYVDTPWSVGIGSVNVVTVENNIDNSFDTFFFDKISLGTNSDLWNNTTLARWTVSSPAAAVPEPETYAMFLAGLGLLGAVSRRRKQKAAV